jgi:arsenite methyltransferase
MPKATSRKSDPPVRAGALRGDTPLGAQTVFPMNTARSLPGDALAIADTTELKTCCAAVYQTEWARLLLGDSFHPGGMALTEHLGAAIGVAPGQRVLDVASGLGSSAIHLAQCFGCAVVGVDYGAENVARATEAAQAAGVAELVTFLHGDAEQLPVADASFDAVICECAFCTFPDKPTAAHEFLRVLKPGGRVGLSDLTRTGDIPPDLRGLLAWISCLADAQPLDEYARLLRDAGLRVDLVEPHDGALVDLVREIQGKLLGAELLVKLNKIALPPTVDFEQAKAMSSAASQAMQAHRFGYAIITATKTA